MSIGNNGRRVSLGIIGLGGRGLSMMEMMLQMEDVHVAALCDRYPDRAEAGAKAVANARGTAPFSTTDYRLLLCRADVEAVVVMTSWETHIPIAVDALRAGKPVAMEVGGATSVMECWNLVNASEETGLPVMLLENCCYGREEMALLNMIRQGTFGTVVHCQGGYHHDLRDEIGNGDINRHYRQNHFMNRNGELYPTHELGPMAKYLNINRGNRMASLVSMASKAVGLHEWYTGHRPESPLAHRAVNQGDIVTTMIRCANGETMLLTHDCTLPRPYCRGGVVRGTRGLWMEENRSIYIEDESNPSHAWVPDGDYMARYAHPLWKAYEAYGVRGGHDGMDYLVVRAFIECLQKGTPPPIDVYDAASWMCITALSEESIACGSAPVAIPDFTSGRWLMPREKGVQGIYSLD